MCGPTGGLGLVEERDHERGGRDQRQAEGEVEREDQREARVREQRRTGHLQRRSTSAARSE